MGKPAQTLTAAIRKFLEFHGWVTWTNSGGAVRVGARFVRFGVKGLPDIMALRQGKFLAIEVKASKGDRVRPEQWDWLDKLKDHGGQTIVARILDDVMREVKT